MFISWQLSNSFYEQVYLFYNLSIFEAIQISTHGRGDILEAYMAAIVEDSSRVDCGYYEVRHWLFQILALRLRRVANKDQSTLYSVGSSKRSLTVIPPISSDGYPVADDLWVAQGPHQSATEVSCNAWSESRQTSSAKRVQMDENLMMIPWQPYKVLDDSDCYDFRRYLFEIMRYSWQNCKNNGQQGLKKVDSFWTIICKELDDIHGAITKDNQIILLLYYRVKTNALSRRISRTGRVE
jgi:hypothetical protein